MESLTHFISSFDDIHLAWAKIREPYAPDILNEAERAELNNFESVSRQREYLATRRLIWEMIRQKNWEPELFQIKKDELGKPYGVYKGNELHLSIAHTANYVLCGLSEYWPVGVDLEPVDREVSDRIRTRIINPNEQQLLSSEPTLRIWTAKEALVKLRGTGIRTNLKDCTLSSAKEDRFTAKFNDEKRAKICSFIHKKNWLAIAWNH